MVNSKQVSFRCRIYTSFGFDTACKIQQLISELNEILTNGVVDEGGLWKKKLSNQSLHLFEFLPQTIQAQLLLERDPHGNVQVAKIETEKMLIEMVDTKLESWRRQGLHKSEFRGQSHFLGYEGRCGLPSNFDANYCYALGYAAGALLHSGKTGLISSVCAFLFYFDSLPDMKPRFRICDISTVGFHMHEKWTVSGTALTSLMDVERRHGKFKPVINKAMVELQGAPFKKFASMREEWALKNHYSNPGPLQYGMGGYGTRLHVCIALSCNRILRCWDTLILEWIYTS